MINKPYSLTEKEIREIAELHGVRDMWGAENAVKMVKLLSDTVYAARFDYSSLSQPGYTGDVFLLMGDALGEPVTLIRDGKTQSLRLL